MPQPLRIFCEIPLYRDIVEQSLSYGYSMIFFQSIKLNLGIPLFWALSTIL